MNASLRALLSGVVDYAGLFPPAGLPLDEAIRNYARYRQGPDAWMLGRFVIPASRLPAELSFRISAVGRGVDDPTVLRESVSGDLTAIGSLPTAEAYELKGPFEPASVVGAAELVLNSGATLFYEIGFAGDWRRDLAEVAAAVSAFNADYPDDRAGLKLRCGAPGPSSAFPAAEEVAHVLRVCRDAGVPLKFTAGLHHPIRHFDAALQAPMHGFINVFTAGVLAHARGLGEEDLRAVLADEDPAAFVFSDDGLRWRDWHASTAGIAAARTDFVTSFGSCSFDEPRDDLRALGWM